LELKARKYTEDMTSPTIDPWKDDNQNEDLETEETCCGKALGGTKGACLGRVLAT